ncbi:MAG: hypothetical protein R2848_12970 [Thermomicrobiales bacterium]
MCNRVKLWQSAVGVAAEPLLRAIYASVVERGGLPVLMPEFGGLGIAEPWRR